DGRLEEDVAREGAARVVEEAVALRREAVVDAGREAGVDDRQRRAEEAADVRAVLERAAFLGGRARADAVQTARQVELGGRASGRRAGRRGAAAVTDVEGAAGEGRVAGAVGRAAGAAAGLEHDLDAVVRGRALVGRLLALALVERGIGRSAVRGAVV